MWVVMKLVDDDYEDNDDHSQMVSHLLQSGITRCLPLLWEGTPNGPWIMCLLPRVCLRLLFLNKPSRFLNLVRFLCACLMSYSKLKCLCLEQILVHMKPVAPILLKTAMYLIAYTLSSICSQHKTGWRNRRTSLALLPWEPGSLTLVFGL